MRTKLLGVFLTIIVAAALEAEASALPERDTDRLCGLISDNEVAEVFHWPPGIGLHCEEGGGRSGQWNVSCEDASNPNDCEDEAEITAVESYGLKVPKGKSGDRYLRELRKVADDRIAGHMALTKVRGSAPTSTQVTVLGPSRKVVAMGVYSYQGGQVGGAHALAKRALDRYFR